MTTEDKMDDLYKKAKAATPGPWITDGFLVIPKDAFHVTVCSTTMPADKEYIAAASPGVVMALIDRIRELEKKLKPKGSYARYDTI